MEAVAIVLSAVATITAVLSWLASRRSGKAAEASAREAAALAAIERDRRHDERKPTWDIVGSETADELVEFALLIRGPEHDYAVEVEVVDGSVVPAVRLSPSEAVSRQRLALGQVRMGVPVKFWGDTIAGQRSGQRFKLEFRAGESSWSAYAECEISWQFRVY